VDCGTHGTFPPTTANYISPHKNKKKITHSIKEKHNHSRAFPWRGDNVLAASRTTSKLPPYQITPKLRRTIWLARLSSFWSGSQKYKDQKIKRERERERERDIRYSFALSLYILSFLIPTEIFESPTEESESESESGANKLDNFPKIVVQEKEKHTYTHTLTQKASFILLFSLSFSFVVSIIAQCFFDFKSLLSHTFVSQKLHSLQLADAHSWITQIPLNLFSSI